MEQKSSIRLLKEDENFGLYVEFKKAIVDSERHQTVEQPVKLYVKKINIDDAKPAITLNLDTPDHVSFTDFSGLINSDDDEKIAALKLFNQGFNEYLGGKLFLKVPKAIVALVKENTNSIVSLSRE